MEPPLASAGEHFTVPFPGLRVVNAISSRCPAWPETSAGEHCTMPGLRNRVAQAHSSSAPAQGGVENLAHL